MIWLVRSTIIIGIALVIFLIGYNGVNFIAGAAYNAPQSDAAMISQRLSSINGTLTRIAVAMEKQAALYERNLKGNFNRR